MAERLFLRLEGDPLHAPESTVPAGTLREFAVPAALAGCVAHVMAYDEVLPAGTTVHERVLPDGALRLIFDLHAGAAPAQVAGPSTQPVLLQLQGRMRGLSITLRPGAALRLFGVSAHELAERLVPWDALVPAPARSLPFQLHEAGHDAGRVRVLLDGLRQLRRDVDPAERQVATSALGLLVQRDAPFSVRTLARAVGVGERRLQQVFQSQLGLTPRAWSRLARLHACLRLLRRPAPPRWAELAAEGGFYDQAHLANEFRALCGLTPTEFLRRATT